MNRLLQSLLEKAFRQVPAREANEAIAAARADVESEFGPGLSYELVLDPAQEESALRAHALDSLLPRFVYFVTSRRSGWPDCQGLVVSLFVGEQLAFVHGSDLADWLVSLSGDDAATLRERHGA